MYFSSGGSGSRSSRERFSPLWSTFNEWLTTFFSRAWTTDTLICTAQEKIKIKILSDHGQNVFPTWKSFIKFMKVEIFEPMGHFVSNKKDRKMPKSKCVFSTEVFSIKWFIFTEEVPKSIWPHPHGKILFEMNMPLFIVGLHYSWLCVIVISVDIITFGPDLVLTAKNTDTSFCVPTMQLTKYFTENCLNLNLG